MHNRSQLYIGPFGTDHLSSFRMMTAWIASSYWRFIIAHKCVCVHLRVLPFEPTHKLVDSANGLRSWTSELSACMPRCFSHVQLFVTLWTRNLPGFFVPGILQARILVWVAMPFSRGSSLPGDGTWVSCIADRCFTVWATREAYKSIRSNYKWPRKCC